MNRRSCKIPWQNACRDEEASVLVEFSLAIPFLLALSLGVIEFGRALYHHHVLNKSVREAARYLSHVEATCPVGSLSGTFVNGTDVTVAKSLALTGYPSGSSYLLSYWSNPATVTVNVKCVDNTSASLLGKAMIPIVQVRAELTYQDIGFLSALNISPIVFHALHEEVHFGRS